MADNPTESGAAVDDLKAAGLMIYGANGYTGTLIAERAAERGLTPILAGRSEGPVRALAERLGLPWRVFDLKAVGDGLAGVSTVLMTAGPFSKTAEPMVRACMAAGANYVDITGEIAVFEALHAMDNEAGAAGIVMLPGAGFDVVPSDCLAAHVHRRLPDATKLSLVIGGLDDVSRGTAKTMLEGVAMGTAVRRGGRIVTLDEPPRGSVDLGGGVKPTVGVSWGDVSTAYHSTGIPHIDVYFEASEQMEKAMGMPPLVRRFMGSALGQWIGRKAIDRMPPGPTAAVRETARAVLLADAENDKGERAASELETPEGYKLTAMTALEAALRVDRGEVQPGFQTPSKAFGPDFVMGFAGVVRRDL